MCANLVLGCGELRTAAGLAAAPHHHPATEPAGLARCTSRRVDGWPWGWL